MESEEFMTTVEEFIISQQEDFVANSNEKIRKKPEAKPEVPEVNMQRNGRLR